MAGITIVGSGDCGTRAAFSLRENDYKGIINLINNENGLPYERPPLSKQNGDVVKINSIMSPEEYEKHSINLISNTRVLKINRESKFVSLSNGIDLYYDKLLISTGAYARPLQQDKFNHCLYLRSKNDAELIFAKLPLTKKAVIIGAGLIGLEMAALLRNKNIEVSVLQDSDRILERAVPEKLAEIIAEKHKSEGVKFFYNAQIENIEKNCITLATKEKIQADLIISAIGAVAKTDLAIEANLPCANGIIVNGQLRTDDPYIYAAGDCAICKHPRYGSIRFETWRNAVDQGEFVAKSILGSNEEFNKLPWFWSDQYELSLQVVGVPSLAETTVKRSIKKNARVLFHLSSKGQLVAASGLGPGNSVAKTIRLAELLIEKNKQPLIEELEDENFNLKKLL